MIRRTFMGISLMSILNLGNSKEISKENNPKTFEDNKRIAKKGGEIAGDTRKKIEQQTGRSIVSPQNAKIFKEYKKNRKLK